MKTNKAILESIGPNGKMISHSKSGYRRENPESVAVFNSNMLAEDSTGNLEKIWWGDIDVTKEEDSIKSVARELGKKIWILPESAAFDGEKPQMDMFVYSTNGTESEVGGKYYATDRIGRNEKGILILTK